ncbi:Flp family type IVb pilin [Aeromicrobium sp. Root495]|nr:Flp family type IVb pilin [Aeromicrobium sp. Root495]
MRELLKRQRVETGASAVEYGLLIAFVAAIIAGSVAVLGALLPGLYTVPF